MYIVKYFRRKKELKLLLSYADKFKNMAQYPAEYSTPQWKVRINNLHWLIAIYQQESKPELRAKGLLEKLINLSNTDEYTRYPNRWINEEQHITELKNLHTEIQFLYNWVYYKKITGF